MVTWIISELVENYAAHPELVDNVDWYIMPVINPDGYEFSHTNVILHWYLSITSIYQLKCNGYRAVFGARTVNLTMAIASVPITTETSDTIGEARTAFKFAINPLTFNFLVIQREAPAITVVRKFTWAQRLSRKSKARTFVMLFLALLASQNATWPSTLTVKTCSSRGATRLLNCLLIMTTWSGPLLFTH